MGDYFFDLEWRQRSYNYKEISEGNSKKWVLDLLPNSDTEVLMHWLAFFGIKGLENLRVVLAYSLGAPSKINSCR